MIIYILLTGLLVSVVSILSLRLLALTAERKASRVPVRFREFDEEA
ncbi:hypothetical protein ACFLV7_10330 [Chloroflexota bacterium]